MIYYHIYIISDIDSIKHLCWLTLSFHTLHWMIHGIYRAANLYDFCLVCTPKIHFVRLYAEPCNCTIFNDFFQFKASKYLNSIQSYCAQKIAFLSNMNKIPFYILITAFKFVLLVANSPFLLRLIF